MRYQEGPASSGLVFNPNQTGNAPMTDPFLPPPTRAVLRDAVHSRCKNILFALLCGSHAKSAGKPNSDVDILVVVGKVASARRELFHFQGYLFDLHVHDAETLAFVLSTERRAGPVALLSMVVEGIPLGASAPIYEDLLAFAKASLIEGPSDPNWILLRHQMTETHSDLCDCVDQEERKLLAMDLYKQIINLHLLTHNIFPCRDRNIVRTLRTHDQGLADRLSGALAIVFSHDDSVELTSLAIEVLEGAGGPLSAGFSFSFPTHFRAPLPVSRK